MKNKKPSKALKNKEKQDKSANRKIHIAPMMDWTNL